ncbi:MAG TPA: phosphate ABC transporter substrate-binding protein PstS [Acidimicrobiia bacterium]|jgi:phosphate transport system substrate-binding protein
MNKLTVRIARLVAAVAFLAVAVSVTSAGPASADSYVPVSGSGSTWSYYALNQWIRDVQQYGMRINYAPNGSSQGRQQFLQGTVDFAASDIPFQSHPTDGSAPENPVPGSYAYMPITSGGTVFMYNLQINGKRVTDLRLSGENIAKIFTHQITLWNDPAIAADNPGLNLPARAIVPVVRSDGAAASYHLSEWMIDQYPSIWNAYCSKSGRAPACGATSNYPTVSGMIAQSGDLGVSGYVSQSYADGAIGYVAYAYALQTGFPVAKMLNAAGYYTEPTAQNVAVSLLKAKINTDSTDPSVYLTQNLTGVYSDTDPRTYPLSSYGYLILPIKTQGQFTSAKGKTLAAFAYYAMCQGQQESASLGYSPMPINLVQASFTQINRIPGAVVQNINIQHCNNPTFTSSGVNELAATAPFPPACDKKGAVQCNGPTGGSKSVTTPSKGPSNPGGSNTSGTGSTKGGGSTGTAPGGSSTSATSGATGGSGSDPSSNSTGTTAACDPTSGTCGASSSSNGTGPTELAASPTVLGGSSGWGGTQLLVVLVVILLVVVIIVPGLLARRLYRSSRS